MAVTLRVRVRVIVLLVESTLVTGLNVRTKYDGKMNMPRVVRKQLPFNIHCKTLEGKRNSKHLSTLT